MSAASDRDPPPRPSPEVDEASRPYWEAARAHRLAVQRCRACGRYVLHARGVCPHCHRAELGWATAAGTGTVYSFTVVRRPAGPGFAPLVPYVVALVDLDEGPRLLSTLRVRDPASVRVGQRVTVAFEALDEVTLPVFEAAE